MAGVVVSLTREQLIEAAKDAALGHWKHSAPTIVVDAVLHFIADDLERATLGRLQNVGWYGGIGWAADHVRSLLPSTEGDQP